VRDRSFVDRRPQWILNAPGRDGWFEVIGVVRDAPNRGLREPIAPAMYYPYSAALSDTAVLLVRTKGNPTAAERAPSGGQSRRRQPPIIRFIPPETFMGWQQGQFVTAVLLGFAAVAVVLAAFGLFSAASYGIAHRSREFGIRIALGATRRAVLRAAFQSTAIAVAAGAGTGLIASLALNSVLERWSIHSLDDALVLAGVIGALLVTTTASALIPARRAMRIEPATALKSE